MSGVRDSLSWVSTMLMTSGKDRKKWVKIILKNLLTAFNPAARPGETEELVNLLDGPDVEIIGIAPNIQYLRVDGSENFLKAWWIHPNQPTLIAKHKRLPLVFLAGPSLRFNETVIKEVNPEKGIQEESLVGFTG
ncbi:MAG: hypothetical protein EBZ61_06815 [Micrococcales bacterium]|nr:hypothetical protein [Micrococcales bacterium]